VKLERDFMAIFSSHSVIKKHSRWVNIFFKKVFQLLIYFIADNNLIHCIHKIKLTDFEIKIKLEEDELARKQKSSHDHLSLRLYKNPNSAHLGQKCYLFGGKQCPETGTCVTAVEDAVPERVILQGIHF
jgi:hypothetical protein